MNFLQSKSFFRKDWQGKGVRSVKEPKRKTSLHNEVVLGSLINKTNKEISLAKGYLTEVLCFGVLEDENTE